LLLLACFTTVAAGARLRADRGLTFSLCPLRAIVLVQEKEKADPEEWRERLLLAH